MATYDNQVNITSGRKVVVQQPMDDRNYYDTVAQIASDISNNRYFAWFRFMPIYIAELHEWAIWLNVEEATNLNLLQDAQIPGTNAVYNDPAFNGTIYENAVYQFYRTYAIPVPHSHLEGDILDLDKYSKAEITQLLTGKQDNLPSNTTGTVTVLHSNSGGQLYWAVINAIQNPIDSDFYSRTNAAWQKIYNVGFSPIVGFAPTSRLNISDKLVLPGGAYVLQDPTITTPNYSVYIIHDGQSSLSINLTGWPINGINYSIAAPFVIPQFQSVHLAVVNGAWRHLNIIT